MSNLPLVDQAARDAITNHLDRTIFVEAGAGTGKTRSLIERAVRLIATGRATAASLAAITFTEAAAAELRDRLRGALEQAATDAALDASERQRCREALDDLDSAAVETIHAFCRRLLTAYPLEAGLPPGFDLVTDTEAESAFREQWNAWFDSFLERADREAPVAVPLLRVLALGGKVEQLQQLASELRQHWDRLRPADEPIPQPAFDVADVISRGEELCGLQALCGNPDDSMVGHLSGRIAPALRRLQQANDEFATLAALRPLALNGNAPFGNFTRTGNQGNWGREQIASVREEVVAFHGDMLALFRGAAHAAMAEITREISQFVLDAAAERRRAGRLEFQDLLVIARELLAGRPDIRAAVRARFSHLFIDEFQDTDPLQAEIAFLLGTSAGGVIEDGWIDLPLDPGRIFFVGDPKQSIYRFRRADIELYQRVQEAFEASTERLTQNFRSVPGVIAWVNAQFARRFGEASTRQARAVDLAAARERLPGSPAVYRIGGELDEKMEVVRESEAAAIVTLLREIEAGGWLVQGEDGPRTARLADVAVLSPTRPAFATLLDTFEEHGVSHRVESRTMVYEAQEVRDFIAILRAIDDPTDEVALVAALRSPAFACGDDDLLRYAAVQGAWDLRRDPPDSLPADDPVLAGLRWLRAAHERRWWIPLTQLVDEVVAERRLLELALVDRRPRERWQRLRYVAEQARAYAERPEASLRGLIDWLQRQAEEGQQVLERVVPEADDDAVRVMTIHASKGLEFPIVILVGLNRGSQRGQGRQLVWSDAGDPEVRLGNQLETAGYEAAAASDRQLEDAEAERLLYVAMTRAEDHLVLSCYHTARGESEAKNIRLFAEEYPELCLDITPEPATAESEHARPVHIDDVVEPPSREEWIAARRALVDSHRRRRAVSATALAREQLAQPDADVGFEKDPPADEAPPWRRGRAGTSIGRAVHSVLQTVNLETGADLEAIANAQATAEGVPDRAAEVARLARAALESSAVREAVSAARYWREVYVATDIDGVIVDGFIDLLYETDGGFVVVDYKTDAIARGHVDEAVERYRPQALAYALVLSQQLQRPVLRCDFVFLRAPSEAAVHTVPVSEQALGDLRVAVAG